MVKIQPTGNQQNLLKAWRSLKYIQAVVYVN